ncbi:MAG: ADOP family duplicated permease [Gemmatimonadales bacterium]
MMIPFGHRDDDELDEEIQSHLDLDTAERIRRGAASAEASAAARRDFGNVGYFKETAREVRGGVWIERLWQDLRYAGRSLSRSPSFTIVAILTLALGIGATTAIFTVVRSVLLRPLPFRDSERLVALEHMPEGIFHAGPSMVESEYAAYRHDTRTLRNTTMYNVYPMSFVGAGEPVRLAGARVTPSFLGVLGVRPILGRDFRDDDAMAPVLLVSNALWRERFGGDTAAIGRSVEVDGERRTIIGVLPSTFDFPSQTQVWLPTTVNVGGTNMVIRPVIGRLAPGVTREQARAELINWTTHNVPTVRVPERVMTDVVSLRDAVIGDVRRPLLIFMAAVTFVLLIACANVTSLFIMRGASRAHELGIRAVLGASRRRIMRQLLTESLVLAIAGGLAGLAVASVAVRALMAMMPEGLLPRAREVGIDGTVLGAIALICVATGCIFGVAPALAETRRTLHLSATRVTRRLRTVSALVALETALSLTLLVGAGLMIQSFVRLRAVNPGFQPDNLVMATVDLPDARYQSIAQLHEFVGNLTGQLAGIPGVTGTAAVDWRPLDPTYITGYFALADGLALPPDYVVLKPCVTPNYFGVMGIPLREGRAFTSGDDAHAPRVVVVSRSMANRFWPAGGAVGQRITMVDKPRAEDWMTIVGVVDDVVHEGLARRPTPAIYQAIAQVENRYFINHLTFVAKAKVSVASVSGAMRRAVNALDPELPVGAVMSMQGIVASSIAEPRFQMRMLTFFSAMALALAIVGIYGVLAYFVVERKHEIGIRMALGASPGAVRRMVVARSLTMTGIGLGIGIAASIALARVLGRFLFEITPGDPVTFAGVALLLIVVAVITSWVPAVRASRTDPLIVIRRA